MKPKNLENFIRPKDVSLRVWLPVDPKTLTVPSSAVSTQHDQIVKYLDMLAKVRDDDFSQIRRESLAISKAARPHVEYSSRQVLKRPIVQSSNLLLTGAGLSTLSMDFVSGQFMRFVIGSTYRLLGAALPDTLTTRAEVEKVLGEVETTLKAFFQGRTRIDFQGEPVPIKIYEWMKDRLDAYEKTNDVSYFFIANKK